MVLVTLAKVVFGPARRGLGVAITVWDDAVVGWLAGLHLPGLTGLMEAIVASAGSAAVVGVVRWAVLVALLVGAVIGVAVSVAAYRLFVPSEIFPVTYRRGRSAHLDVGGRRGEAIRDALADQLGLTVVEVKPFGLSGSAGSTPLRIQVEDGAGGTRYVFGKLYARSHLRADRSYKFGRALLYGRLEDEKPFSTVRRLVQQEDYALSLMQRRPAQPAALRCRRAHPRAGVPDRV